jgi:vitamin B12 transporter
MFCLVRRAAGASFLLLCASPLPLAAQVPPSSAQPPNLEVTVTANRIPTAIQRTGSALSIVSSEDIARANPGSLVDALRAVPGLDITETGGPGATTAIRLRGANAGQTLVLIDGVRINDPDGASGEFDPSLLAPGLIDRIEVLRGPQSALYGSDAIGGVVNILTRRGRGAPRFSAGVEAGSYGTISTNASASGAIGPWSFAFSGVAQRSDGFSRFGERIGRLGTAFNSAGVRGGPLEDDGFSRIGGFGRIGYDAGQGFRFDLGVVSVETRQDYDAAFGTYPDTRSNGVRRFHQLSARAELDTFDGALTHALQLFVNRTDRRFRDASLALRGGVLSETRTLSDFIGDRYGVEYQATLRLPQLGSVIAGARFERETADTFAGNLSPVASPRRRTLAAGQETASLFALWQWPVTERLTISLGGRHDQVSDAGGFPTWRATAAYRIAETGTKLRASAGTGAKAPTLFQRFSPQFGTAGLDPERSVGFDVGIDQDVLDGRVTLSVTAFANRLRNLIDFSTNPGCRPDQTGGCYVNVSRATTSGVEVAARARVIEGLLSASLAYTYLDARDATTNLTLARRPRHLGRIALQITPAPGWLIEPSVVLVSERFSAANERNRLAPYARFDVAAEYRFNDTWRAHARVENITNARYQEVFNYGTTGRAFYAGLTATW